MRKQFIAYLAISLGATYLTGCVNIAEVKEQANAGNVDSMLRIAKGYAEGWAPAFPSGDIDKLDKDDKHMIYWYMKAADQGNAAAMLSLGEYYINKNNYASALEWFNKAINAKDNNANTFKSVENYTAIIIIEKLKKTNVGSLDYQTIVDYSNLCKKLLPKCIPYRDGQKNIDTKAELSTIYNNMLNNKNRIEKEAEEKRKREELAKKREAEEKKVQEVVYDSSLTAVEKYHKFKSEVKNYQSNRYWNFICQKAYNESMGNLESSRVKLDYKNTRTGGSFYSAVNGKEVNDISFKIGVIEGRIDMKSSYSCDNDYFYGAKMNGGKVVSAKQPPKDQQPNQQQNPFESLVGLMTAVASPAWEVIETEQNKLEGEYNDSTADKTYLYADVSKDNKDLVLFGVNKIMPYNTLDVHINGLKSTYPDLTMSYGEPTKQSRIILGTVYKAEFSARPIILENSTTKIVIEAADPMGYEDVKITRLARDSFEYDYALDLSFGIIAFHYGKYSVSESDCVPFTTRQLDSDSLAKQLKENGHISRTSSINSFYGEAEFKKPYNVIGYDLIDYAGKEAILRNDQHGIKREMEVRAIIVLFANGTQTQKTKYRINIYDKRLLEMVEKRYIEIKNK